MIPRRVKLAVLIAFLCHGLFILTAHYRLSYDAFTHMLFANHYAEDWFSLWEPRWYTGFTVVSYPPLTHQLIALFIPILGFDKAFALILWVVATLYPLGIYAFSRIFTGKISASYAALASAIFVPIYVTAYVFGQFPFLASTLVALFGAAALARYLREGGPHNLLLTISLFATTMAAHHATLILQPFLILAVFVSQVNRQNWQVILFRSAAAGLGAILAEWIVIWPFWDWGMTQIMQTPIDHLSRHNFVRDPLAFLIFFIPLYGPFLAVMPFVFSKWPRQFWGLTASFIILLILGLGGTTPLPRWFFGNNWQWLTYDRFAFWAGLTLTPFFGVLFIRARRRFTTTAISESSSRKLLTSLTASIFATMVLLAWLQPFLFPTQPAPVDMQPIVRFLNQGDRSQWRYITLGFGNQYAYLNLLTKATTIDGSYHTARTLPELRKSGVAEVDTSFWAVNGMDAIVPILRESGEHGVRWGFVDPNTVETIQVPKGVIRRSPFLPVLESLGWDRVTTLENGVFVYENPVATLPVTVRLPRTTPITSFSWGVLPIVSLITTLCLGGLRVYPFPAERVIRAMHAFAVGLVPITLCFWFYKAIAEFPQPRVYFTFTDALFYFSDALALFAVILWASTKLPASHPLQATRQSRNTPLLVRIQQFILPLHSHAFVGMVYALFLLASFSLLWSQAPSTSLYIALHLWLIFLFILSLRDWHEAWKIAMFGLCAALSIEIIAGFAGFALQSTAFLETLDMEWPGVLDPSLRGASVVQLVNGLRILRAYGTLPHPNFLGGLTLVCLLGTSTLFLTGKRPNYAALMLHSLGVILMAITFSRSAWLGLLAFLGILILKWKYFDRGRILLFLATNILTLVLALYPLRELVLIRVSNAPVATEQYSIYGREWLSLQAVDMFHTRPLAGVGIGSFIIELSSYAVEDAMIEPVHNIFLLAGSELGIIGLLLIMVLSVWIVLKILKSRRPAAILAGATVAGLGVIGLFDHYFWTLAPGRVMLALTLGLWIGQITHDA